ncbi:hypothetical protein M2140_000253 [Clostridiales Family XIII bacterium PM5-7]
MEKDDAVRETKYTIGKYIIGLLEKDGKLSHAQYLSLRDALVDEYQPVIGELEKGADYENQ